MYCLRAFEHATRAVLARCKRTRRRAADFDWLVLRLVYCFGHVIKTMVRYWTRT